MLMTSDLLESAFGLWVSDQGGAGRCRPHCSGRGRSQPEMVKQLDGCRVWVGGGERDADLRGCYDNSGTDIQESGLEGHELALFKRVGHGRLKYRLSR